MGLPKASATSIIGAYGGMVYLAAVLGAWVADRLAGAERTLFYSAVTVMVGHIALAVLPGLTGVAVGLVLVALGSGGVKTAATSVVGSLYDRNDPRCDAGFSLFYMGLAAIGMAVGLGVYTLGRGNLPASAATVPNPLPSGAWPRPVAIAVGIVVLVVLGFVTTLLLTSPLVDADERSRVRSFIPMWLASVGFWALFQQQFTVVTIYTDERLNRSLFGWEMPIAWVNSLEPGSCASSPGPAASATRRR